MRPDMPDQPIPAPESPVTLEDKAARLLNATMFTALGLLLGAFAIWTAVDAFPRLAHDLGAGNWESNARPGAFWSPFGVWMAIHLARGGLRQFRAALSRPR